jgi:N4-gp56 family major capsid protein
MPVTEYGDITPRTAAYAAKDLLTRAIPYLVLEKFGQAITLPDKNSKVIKFRRYNNLPLATTPLTEGVTPASIKLTYTDVTSTLSQYGSVVEITDVIADTHEDNVFKETIGIMSEQAAQTIETIRYNVLKAGTNVVYSNGSARSAVNTPVTINTIRNAVRALKRQNARPITEVVKSSANFDTANIPPAYVAVCHPDFERDIRSIASFVPAEKYGSISPFENEIGSIEGVRVLFSTLCTPWVNAGGSAGSMLSTGGTNADVYPILIFGKNAYGIVAFKGVTAVTPTVINPTPSKSDPLGQVGKVSWKTMQTAAILNDMWMVRIEAAVTA